MTSLERVIRAAYQLGALGASAEGSRLYTARRWQLWRGPSSALSPDGIRHTADKDGVIYVLPVSVAIRDAVRAGYAYVVLDGTLIPVDRVVANRPSYSGKHRKHGMNLQVIASPDGDILWVSGALPGSVHDKEAEWIWGVLGELEAAGLVTLADKGYQGSTYARIPYRGRNKPESQKQANKAHAKLRSPGERERAAQDLEDSPQAAPLPLARWPAHQGYPRIADPRDIRPGWKRLTYASRLW
jgi:DDE superfamily endonuclease